MISTNFFSQLTICPVCQGYGEEKISAGKNGVCKECGGIGVFFAQIEQTCIWGLPKYVNFKDRTKIKYFIFVLLLISLAFLWLGFYFINWLNLSNFDLLKIYGSNPV